MNPSIADIRKDYAALSLLETDVAADPITQFGTWWQQVLDSQVLEPNAMTLATASADGLPAARVVLLKNYNEQGFVFYTNYQSFKAMHLEENPKACLVFFWPELERQVRITGLVKKVAGAESDAYYNSRPEGSRIGAWASPQSQVVPGREWLDAQFAAKRAEFTGKEISRPPHWGGYLVQPVVVEFWQGRPSRLHDRIQYSLQEGGEWKIERLAP
ncbi:Pyridoxamine 5'-phosphate oxidase [Cnuella takakiae]|uniref:Pyridoxine/pyridoxamine 5'-phosphate oxidase n=1 Tax=Cnuella takakiae TaxID=1302690 RepID=A0A1M5H3X3_9BACT|nr:pyridoxamine 5'-phosphate oxidase [Cnuella takakiae]OLY91122.1 pyridoxamine 5'-phosphate oxidase [Cnuella takakiae]SHG10697.1 Pyridoxamine 5'-phosphate oxidase [Cnuella takakiae]